MNPALNMSMNSAALNLPSQPLATHCFQLSNMFNPIRYAHLSVCQTVNIISHNVVVGVVNLNVAPVCFSEEPPGWELDIKHDVIEECNKHGGVVHIYVDKNSEVQAPRPLTSRCQIIVL